MTRVMNQWWWIKANMDFRIPGLPHSVVKHAQSASVRELIQKIENHPNGHAPQRDLQQTQSFNPFSLESKQVIHDVGNIELCELLEMEPKTQCTVFFNHTGTLVYSTARAGISCMKKEGQINNSSVIRWTFSPWVRHQERKEDLMDIDMITRRDTRNLLRLTNWRNDARKKIPRNPWKIPTRSRIPYSNDWKSSRQRTLSSMGCSCGWRSHSPFDYTRILFLQEQLVALLK